MTYKLIIEKKSTYLHAAVTGINSKENVERYLKDVFSECVAQGCFKLLIEENLKGPRLEMMEVFGIVSNGSTRAMGVVKEIAYVDLNAEGNLMRFAETLAVNRGMRVAIFPTVAEAEKWLVTPESGHPRTKKVDWSRS